MNQTVCTSCACMLVEYYVALGFRTGVNKLWPMGQIQPTIYFHQKSFTAEFHVHWLTYGLSRVLAYYNGRDEQLLYRP